MRTEAEIRDYYNTIKDMMDMPGDLHPTNAAVPKTIMGILQWVLGEDTMSAKLADAFYHASADNNAKEKDSTKSEIKTKVPFSRDHENN